MNPYGKFIGDELFTVQEYLNGNWTDPVKDLETEFARKIGGRYAIAVNSGTSALHAALVACDVKGKEVLMPALCPAMVAFAIIHAGGLPVFCDVDRTTHQIDAKDARKRLRKHTRAILGVSLHGLAFDWAPFRDFDVLYRIDDCAQALGARGIGSADMTCFSFEDKKHLTTGSEGGMILTNNPSLAMRARKFAGLGYKHMTAEAGRTSLAAETYQNPDYERFDTIGLNYRMSKVQACIGMAQLAQLDHIVARRRAVAAMFENVIFALSYGIKENHSYYTYPQQYPITETVSSWQDFYHRFKSNGGDGFYAMPQVPYREPALRDLFPSVSCPVAEELQKSLMLFKTNYRNLGEAERQAEILRRTIRGESNELHERTASKLSHGPRTPLQPAKT